MYIVKLNVSRINGKGETKRVNVQVLADTLIINEAAQIAQFEYKNEECEVVSVAKTSSMVSVTDNGDKFYHIKYSITTIDEVSAKEKKQIMGVYLDADNIDQAKERFKEFCDGSVSDITIVSIKETKIEQYLIA